MAYSGSWICRDGRWGIVLATASISWYRNSVWAEKSSDTRSPLSNAETSEVSVRGSPKSVNDAPKTSAIGFDPEALERGAKALREINASVHAKKVFDLMKKQEDTRQAEENARRAEYQAIQAQHETERQKVLYEEQKKLLQQQAQSKAQLARYEDELTRKRMQAEHDAQRIRNSELVKMQEESALRQESARKQTEQQIQEERRLTEKERAQIERETIRVKAMAEAQGRVHEARSLEDINRSFLVEQAKMEKDKWLAAINATLGQIGGGLTALVTDKDKLFYVVGGATALAVGVYTAREASHVLWSHVGRILGQPALVRESSRGYFPFISRFTRGASTRSKSNIQNDDGFKNVVLAPVLHRRLQKTAAAIVNTKSHGAAYQNILFCGPPGTGKTLVAKMLAKESGLDYALMTGGDVAPLGANAVTKIHELFDWARRSRKGLLLFIDEADAFLCQRNNSRMSEVQRSALNAFLYRTGDQSKSFVLVLATNRPADLDQAVTDRIDDIMEFPLPDLNERVELLKLYMEKYILDAGSHFTWGRLLYGKQGSIRVDGVTDDIIREAAEKIDGFSGREITKLMASVQGAVYGSKQRILNVDLFLEVVQYKVAEHQHRLKLSASG